MAGDELFRIADHSRVWIVADVAEAEIADDQRWHTCHCHAQGLATKPHEGMVTFIYPEMMKPETRTVSVRIELPNPDGEIKPGMYADVVFHAGPAMLRSPPFRTAPSSTVAFARSCLVAKGDGRFEPRAVKLGRRGDGYIEVMEGLKLGEEVVTSATFLIDAESNLKAALQTFGQQEVQP